MVVTDEGRGLGFVVDPAGFMLTNRHVVEDADHIELVQFPGLADVPEYSQVEIVYIDPVRDLALLHIASDEPLPYLELAIGRRAPVSEYVTERDGVVLLSREVDPDDAAKLEVDPGLLAHVGTVERLEVYNPNVGPGPFMGVSARIEQGQSGGPVLDRYGRAVGVVTWTWRDQKGGFAIPIAEAARMLDERPRLGTDRERSARAEERVLSYLAALGRGSERQLSRLTSPSHAREVRERTVDVLIERSAEQSLLQAFITALDDALAELGPNEDPLPGLEAMVEYASSDEIMRELGVDGTMSPRAVHAFFFAVGSAYVAARWFGRYDRRDALLAAFQRVNSLDTARSMALVDTLDQLAGVRSTVEHIEITPGIYAPKAVATVDIGGGHRIAVQMRLEWGDWYISEVQRSSRVPAPPASARR